MGTFLRAIGRGLYVLGTLVFWSAAEVYATIAPWAPTYLRSLGFTAGLWLALIPTFVILKVLTGWVPAAYIAALLAILFSAVLGALGTPIGILVGLLAGKGREAGARYVRLVGAILFFELVGSLYLLLIPLHQNLGAVPLLIVAGVTAIIGSILYRVEAFRPAFFVWAAIAIVILATLSFVFPETFGAVGVYGRGADRNIATQPAMRLLLWGAGLLILTAYVLARALDKPWLKTAAWGLVILVAVLLLADSAIWGPIGGKVTAAPSPAAGEIGREVTLSPEKLSPPIFLPDCTGWNVYPELGGRAEGVLADDPSRTLYHFPYSGDLPFHGPLHLRGEGKATVVFRDIGTHCYKVARAKGR